MSLHTCTWRGGSSFPCSAKHFCITCNSKLSSPVGKPASESLWKNRRVSSASSTRTVVNRFNAIPIESKPGPKFAVLAGATTSTRSRIDVPSFHTNCLQHFRQIPRNDLRCHTHGVNGRIWIFQTVSRYHANDAISRLQFAFPVLLEHASHR